MKKANLPAAGEASRRSWLVVVLFGLFAVEVVWLAWAPADRLTWFLENLLPIPLALFLLASRSWLPLSSVSYLMLFALLGIHEIGSHYTYSLVPYRSWLEAGLDLPLAGERNHYDRFVHLSFGLLVTHPLRQLCAGPLRSYPRLAALVPVCFVLSLSTLYELMEWAAAQIVDPGVGMAFVGAQGDVWDSQKDTGLALCGALLVSVSLELARRLCATTPTGSERRAREMPVLR